MTEVAASVSLEPVSLRHADSMFAWVSDSAIRDSIGLSNEPSPERTREWIRSASTDPTTEAFAILSAGRHVGIVTLDHIEDRTQSARLSIYIGESDARGKGIGLTALRLALRHGFENLGLHRIWLTVHAENLPAIRTYRAAGLILEGSLRDSFRIGDRLIDSHVFAILRTEFENTPSSESPQ